MPLIELIRTFTGKDKAIFKDGAPLKVEVKAQAMQYNNYTNSDQQQQQ